MTPHSTLAPGAWLVAATTLLAAGAVRASEADRLRDMPLPTLQRAYLACVIQSEERALTTVEAAGCSVIHESLKQRMFDGSFDRLLAWTREQQLEHARPLPAAQ